MERVGKLQVGRGGSGAEHTAGKSNHRGPCDESTKASARMRPTEHAERHQRPPGRHSFPPKANHGPPLAALISPWPTHSAMQT